MGDMPINLNSPEQMSWVIYSRKPKDKAMWGNEFLPHMNKDDFRRAVRDNSDIVYKTKAVMCKTCNGTGKIRKVRKNGTPYANTNNCNHCNTQGYIFNPTTSLAGLKFNAPNAKWISANGFGVSKGNLDVLQGMANRAGMKEASGFLQDLKRLSALDTYLSSFVEGIKTHVKSDGMFT